MIDLDTAHDDASSPDAERAALHLVEDAGSVTAALLALVPWLDRHCGGTGLGAELEGLAERVAGCEVGDGDAGE